MLQKIQDIGVDYSEIDWNAVANNREGDYILVDAGYHELYVFTHC